MSSYFTNTDGENIPVYTTRDEAAYRQIVAPLQAAHYYDDDRNEDQDISDYVESIYDLEAMTSAEIEFTDGTEVQHQAHGYYFPHTHNTEAFWAMARRYER